METKRNPLGVGSSYLNRDGTVKDGIKGFNYTKYNKDIMQYNLKELKGKKANKKAVMEKRFDNMTHVLAGELMNKVNGKVYISSSPNKRR